MGEKCKVVVENGAVWLVVETPPDGKRVDKAEAIKQIEALKIKDVDYPEILAAFEKGEPSFRVKVSDNTAMEIKDEGVDVTVSKDGMEAFIMLTRPIGGGKILTEKQIRTIIADNGVRYGINDRLVTGLCAKRTYDSKFSLAKGRLPVDGEAGKLEFHFELNVKKKNPKIREDGKVDFKEIGAVETAYKGQKLVSSVAPTDGEPGQNVRGETVPSRPGRPAPLLPRGKNTKVAPNEIDLLADVTGQIVLENGKVNISPVMDVPGDVGPETGNIDFVGNVTVRGNVKAGYSIVAQGSVEVFGSVEASTIDAFGDIKLYGGVQGSNGAFIITKGSLFLRYSENATLTVARDITADSILHSTVSCGGALYLEGRKCAIVGGSVTVAEKIICKVIGSAMSGETEISTGHMPEDVEEFERCKVELDSAQAEFDKMDKTMASILKGGDLKKLPTDKKELLVKIMHTKYYHGERISELKKRITQLTEKLSSTSGEIYVGELVYAGSKIVIGNALMYVRDDIEKCIMRNVGGKVLICNYANPPARAKTAK